MKKKPAKSTTKVGKSKRGKSSKKGSSKKVKKEKRRSSKKEKTRGSGDPEETDLASMLEALQDPSTLSCGNTYQSIYSPSFNSVVLVLPSSPAGCRNTFQLGFPKEAGGLYERFRGPWLTILDP